MRHFLILAALGTAAAHVWPKHFPSPPAKFGFEARRVEVESGVSVFVVDRPGTDLSLPPAVFVHGVTDSWHSFEKLYGLVDASRRVIAMDLRGHGNSAQTPHNASYSGQRLVQDLRAVVDTLGVEKIGLLVGHSLGSFISWHFAGTWPSQVERLLLIDTSADGDSAMKVFGPVVPAWKQMGEHMPYDFADKWFDDSGDFNASVAGQWFHDTCVYANMQASLPCLMKILPNFKVGGWGDESAAFVPKITATTKLIRGRDDAIFDHAGSDKMLRLLEQGEACQASFLEIPGQGHAPHWTNAGAQVVGAAMLQLLASPSHCRHMGTLQVASEDSSLLASGLTLVLALAVGGAAIILFIASARSRLASALQAPLLDVA